MHDNNRWLLCQNGENTRVVVGFEIQITRVEHALQKVARVARLEGRIESQNRPVGLSQIGGDIAIGASSFGINAFNIEFWTTG